jgi:hypothetical protein
LEGLGRQQVGRWQLFTQKVTMDSLAFHIELIANAIDEVFGDGYAKEHPQLVAAQLQSAALHQLAMAIANK